MVLENHEHPSLVDLQFVSHVERYERIVFILERTKLAGEIADGKISNDGFKHSRRFPEYRATKSDYYTYVMNIPPQYGPGYEDNTAEVKEAMRIINGEEIAETSD